MLAQSLYIFFTIYANEMLGKACAQRICLFAVSGNLHHDKQLFYEIDIIPPADLYAVVSAQSVAAFLPF